LVIVGDVVALRERIQWFERVPLRGRRVLVARARPGRSKIASQLRALGAQVMESPSVSVKELDDYSALDLALVKLDRFDGIVFGCAAGVDAVARRLNLLNLKLDRSAGIAVIAVGEEATETMERTGRSPTLQLNGACHDAVAGSAPDLTSKHLLLIVAAQGRPNLQAELEALGATVEAVSAYRYAYEFAHVNECLPELIVLPSSSAARLVQTGEAGTSLTGIPMLAIGPGTEAAARHHGATNVTQCTTDSSESAVSSAIEMLGRRRLSDRKTLHREDGIPTWNR
jgi:uroporphyrinogen III methyltransferase/synthase